MLIELLVLDALHGIGVFGSRVDTHASTRLWVMGR